MDKRFISICVSLLLLTAVASADTANPSSWYWALAGRSSYQASTTYGGAGVTPDATDGYDVAQNDWQTTPGSRAYLGTYHVNDLEGWVGQTGFYASDVRAPLLLQAGVSKTWEFYVWGDPSMPVNASYIELAWDNYHPLPVQLLFTITLVSKPAGITVGPAVGTVWNLSAQPHGEVQLPVFRTSDGREGYVFDFTATVIPEPSSLAALLTGLSGLGAALRRRRSRGSLEVRR